DRPGDRTDLVAQIDLHDLVARAATGIADRHADGDALAGHDRRRGERRLADFERGVREPVAERIERGDLAEQVTAPRARLVVVERGNLADFARDGDRQLAAGVDAAEQRVGNSRALLLAGVPGLEDRIGFFGQLRVARRTTVDEDRHDRLAERLERA